MFNNIYNKIQKLAVIILICSVVVGGIWFICSFSLYIGNHDFLQYHDVTNIYYLKAVSGKNGMIYSLTLLVSGIISSFLIYGFGELIEKVTSIDNYFKNVETQEKIKKHKEEHEKAVENL